MEKKLHFTTMGNIDFALTENDANYGYHPGNCENEVIELMKQDYIKRQLADISDKDIIDTLTEYGLDFDENDRNEMEIFLVWLACGDITSEFKVNIS